MAIFIIRYLRNLFDVNTTGAVPGDVLTLDVDNVTWVPGAGGGGGGAPTTADYLVGTANASLTNEIVVGVTPGGELGNTWASPTVDTVHSGSSHAATQAAAEATAAAALLAHTSDPTDAHDGSAISNVPAGSIAATDVQAALNELDGDITANLANAVIINPASSARNVIVPTVGTAIDLIIRAHAAQSVDLMQWQTSAAAVLARMTSGGDFVLGQVAANGAGFQFDRSYTDPADLFAAADIAVATTITAATSNDLYAAQIDATLDGAGGTQAGGLTSYSALYSHLLVESVNPDPLAYNLISAYGLNVFIETDPTQDGVIEGIYGGRLAAMHQGAGEAQGITGFQCSAIMKGSPVVNPSFGFSGMQGVTGGIEQTSTREVEAGAMLEALTPYLGSAAGSRFTTLMGLRVNNIGGSFDAAGKTKTSYGIRIDAQAGASIQSYALAALGGKSLFTDGLVIALIAAPADAAYANGEGGWWWDQANSLPKWKGKTSGGVVVNATPYTVGGTDVALADGGTGASLVDPGADRIMFWDDSAGSTAYLTPGTNLTITGTTLDASGGGGAVRQQDYMTALGLIAENWDIGSAVAGALLVSQEIWSGGVYLYAGETITNIVVCVTNAASGTGPTTLKLGLWSSAATPVCLAVTANLAANAMWTSQGYKVAALSAPYVVLADGMHYASILQNGVFSVTNPQFSRNHSSVVPTEAVGAAKWRNPRLKTGATDMAVSDTGTYSRQGGTWLAVS